MFSVSWTNSGSAHGPA